MNSFSSVNTGTTGPLEATPDMSQVYSLLSVNIATPSSLQVVHKFTPGGYLPSVNQALLNSPICQWTASVMYFPE